MLKAGAVLPMDPRVKPEGDNRVTPNNLNPRSILNESVDLDFILPVSSQSQCAANKSGSEKTSSSAVRVTLTRI